MNTTLQAIEQLRHRAAEGDHEALAVLCDHQAELGIHPHDAEIVSAPLVIGSLGDDVAHWSDDRCLGDNIEDGDGSGSGYGIWICSDGLEGVVEVIISGDGFGDGDDPSDGAGSGVGVASEFNQYGLRAIT